MRCSTLGMRSQLSRIIRRSSPSCCEWRPASALRALSISMTEGHSRQKRSQRQSVRRSALVSRLDTRTYDSEAEVVWCPGCGDFSVLRALKLAIAELGLQPNEAFLVSGIGCGSKIPDYMNINGYMTIHGRPLAAATGAKLANPKLRVIVVNGDGDSYGIGGNHFVHTCRRNPDITHIVENNQVYGLTKGQYSPTSPKGLVTTTSPDGAIELAFNPMAVALAGGATFIARAFAREPN